MKNVNKGFSAEEDFGGGDDAQKAAEESYSRVQDTKEDMEAAAQQMADSAPKTADDVYNDNRFNTAYRTKQKIKDKRAESSSEGEEIKGGPLKIDFDKYQAFVDKTTSGPSKDFDALIQRYRDLKKAGCNIERLDTAASGLVAEAGEFMEIVKKLKFQGKPWEAATEEHLIRELGDVMWYAMNAAIALGVRLDEVIYINVLKLAARYPGEKFSEYYSENRKQGDL